MLLSFLRDKFANSALCFDTDGLGTGRLWSMEALPADVVADQQPLNRADALIVVFISLANSFSSR